MTTRNLASKRRRRTLTLGDYVLRRTGVPLGAPGSLQNMLRRSLGARSFARFWQYWNPIFGYGLGRYVFVPLKRALPASLALLLTFLVNGIIHDLVTVLVRGSSALLFTTWFLLLGVGVLVGQWGKMDLSRHAWAVRAAVNLIYLLGCFGIAWGLTR